MARQPRIDLPGMPQHLVQRGNNRDACFFSDADRCRYLAFLRKAAERSDALVHAYVLMTNHVHLLATGAEDGSLGRMMQSLGRQYVRYFNSRYERTGTLWEGRFKSSLIGSDRYLLACYRYIELNPVRACMVELPCEYKWSSFAFNANGQLDELITPHATYLGLGKTAEARASAYRRMFLHDGDNDELQSIRSHLRQGRVLGSDTFKDRIEKSLGCRAHLARPGRPRKKVL